VLLIFHGGFMSEKISRKEALIFKKLLTVKDDQQYGQLAQQLKSEIKNRLGDDKHEKVFIEMTSKKSQYANDPKMVGFAKTAHELRKKMAASLTDDEFVEWIDSEGRSLAGTVKLTPQEMEIIKGGGPITNTIHSVFTVTVGCLVSMYMGKCGLYER